MLEKTKKIIKLIRSGELFQRVKEYLVFENITISLSANLDDVPQIRDTGSITFEIMQPNNDKDVLNWEDIVKQAYNIKRRKNFEIFDSYILNNPNLNIINTFFLKIDNKPIGTISIGSSKQHGHIGGVTRIAILPGYRGKGLGKIVVLYGYGRLRDIGFIKGKSDILIKRKTSIFLHFDCGFKPDFSPKGIRQKVANMKLEKMYNRWKSEKRSEG